MTAHVLAYFSGYNLIVISVSYRMIQHVISLTTTASAYQHAGM